MRTLLLTLALVCIPAALAQDPAPAPVPPLVSRVPGTALTLLVPVGPSADFIQVLVRTANPKTVMVRVTLTYLFEGSPVVAVSERPMVNGLDLHSFTVPSYQVPIMSVNIKEFVIASDQTYTGY
jgi:hypothetical protein